MAEERLCVIFDVDGVLVDSYAAHFNSWRALADTSGCHKMTEDEFRQTFGRTSREIIAEPWFEPTLTAAEIRELDAKKEELFREQLRSDFRAMPGAATLIESLVSSDFSIAAGSSGPPDNVYLVLDQLGGRDRFSAVITGVDVTRGKPDPEVFLLCAQQLGAPPARCAVIEDAVVGIEAANQAGMLSIALVPDGNATTSFNEADHVTQRLPDLSPMLIRRWIQERRGSG